MVRILTMIIVIAMAISASIALAAPYIHGQ